MKKILTYLFIGMFFFLGMVNVDAISKTDIHSDIIDLSSLIEYSLTDEKHIIEIKGLDEKEYKTYYEWLNVTDKTELLADLENYNAKYSEYQKISEDYLNASAEDKEALFEEVEKVRTELLGLENLYYEQLTKDAEPVDEDFIETTDLDVSIKDPKKNNVYLLWVKVVVPGVDLQDDGDSSNSNDEVYYNHAYVKVEEELVKEEAKPENPDTSVSSPYMVAIPVLLVVGFGTIVLKNRYNH